jgi:hypothetical protein
MKKLFAVLVFGFSITAFAQETKASTSNVETGNIILEQSQEKLSGLITTEQLNIDGTITKFLSYIQFDYLLNRFKKNTEKAQEYKRRQDETK